MTLKEWLVNHSRKVLAMRCGVSDATMRRYMNQDTHIPLHQAMKIEIATNKEVSLTDLLTDEQKVELQDVKSEMRNLHKPRVVTVVDYGEDLL